MGLSSAAAIAFSAMQSQASNPSAADDAIITEDADYAPERLAVPEDEAADAGIQAATLSEEEQAYRANAEAFETGADLWAILNVVTRD
ncbi:hypothetical protein [Rhizobium sp.]